MSPKVVDRGLRTRIIAFVDSMHESVVTALLAMPRAQWPVIAQDAAVPLATLQKVAYRHTPNPRVHTVESLARAIRKRNCS